MVKYLLFCLSLIFTVQVYAEENKFTQLTQKLIAKNIDEQAYNQEIEEYISSFREAFITPIKDFGDNYLETNKDSLFYPFSGPDISYPLLLFPQVKSYVLIGLEFPGNSDIVNKNFQLSEFKPQVKGYLTSGFFKTMNMSAQMHYHQGVIPILLTQIGLLDGVVHNIENISEPLKGIRVEFTHNNLEKKLYYFRANLDDHNDKAKIFQFLEENQLLSNCMLKASSYKLHQIEFKQLLQFMSNKCELILQDDTGVPVKLLQQQGREIELFGDYINPYGSEFRPYYQKELANLYQKQKDKIELNFCFGYGCKKAKANILVAR
jgi:hypothetical protein